MSEQIELPDILPERAFYVGYKACGCPVVACSTSAPTECVVESVVEMLRSDYIVKHMVELPREYLEETCAH